MYISVDIEADGPVPGQYSMLSLGAVVVEPSLDRTFYATFRPLPHAMFSQDALAASGFTRKETQEFPDAYQGMYDFYHWLLKLKEEDKRLIFVSDNPIFDGMFVWHYFASQLGSQHNLFGFSGFSLTSFAKGWERDLTKNHKKHRVTKHSHNSLQDALGNAEALLWYMSNGLKTGSNYGENLTKRS